MHRFVFSNDKVENIKKDIRTKNSTPLLRRFNVQLKPSGLWFENKRIIPQDDIKGIIHKEIAQNGCPIAIESGYNYLRKKYIGISRSSVKKVLQALPSYQLMKRRPDRFHRSDRPLKEGSAAVVLRSEKNINAIGIDLMEPKNDATKFSYFLTAVHMLSGYTWAVGLLRKKPGRVLAKMKPILEDCKKRFGVCKVIMSDHGGEFMGSFQAYLASRDIAHRNNFGLVAAVEKKNSQFARSFNFLRGNGLAYNQALRLALQKINNVYSRKIKKAPSDFNKHDVQQFKDKKMKRVDRTYNADGKRKKQPVLLYPISDLREFNVKLT